MTSPQVNVILRDKLKDPNGLNLVQVAVAKRNLPHTHITIICAVGYEGGGCYADFCGVYRMDEHGEMVTEIIEEVDTPADSVMFSQELQQLDAWLYSNAIFYDEDEDAHRLNTDLNSEIQGDSEKYYDLNFDWDNESHIEASQNWGISYSW